MCSISLYMPWSNMVYVVCSSIPWWESLHWVYQSLSMDWWPSPMYAYVHFFIASENLPKSKLFVGWGREKTCTNPIVSICRLQHVAIVHMYEYKCIFYMHIIHTISKNEWVNLTRMPSVNISFQLWDFNECTSLWTGWHFVAQSIRKVLNKYDKIKVFDCGIFQPVALLQAILR